MRIEITSTQPGSAPTAAARLARLAPVPAPAIARPGASRRPFPAHSFHAQPFAAGPATPVPVRWDAVRR